MPLSHLIRAGLTAAAVSSSLSAIIVYSQKWHGKLSHDHDLEGVQKVHSTAVPRIGGVAVLAGVMFGVLLFCAMYPGAVKASHITRIFILLGASLPAFAAGFVEDFTKRVSVRVRLAATIFSALIASALLGATVNELDIWGIDALLRLVPVAIIVTAIVVAGGANSINIIDGFHGLSASVVIVMSVALGVVAFQSGDQFVALLSALGSGAALGFLLINYPSGKLFLGDGGAYFLGFWVSEIAVLLLVRNPQVNAWQVLSICAYPVIEVLFSIYRRKFVRNRNAGAADALHLHTLIYRRVVSRLVAKQPDRTWLRNAVVACVIVPWVALIAIVTVLVPSGTFTGICLVLIQAVVYVAIYTRLVRNRWRRIKPNSAAPSHEANQGLL